MNTHKATITVEAAGMSEPLTLSIATRLEEVETPTGQIREAVVYVLTDAHGKEKVERTLPALLRRAFNAQRVVLS